MPSFALRMPLRPRTAGLMKAIAPSASIVREVPERFQAARGFLQQPFYAREGPQKTIVLPEQWELSPWGMQIIRDRFDPGGEVGLTRGHVRDLIPLHEAWHASGRPVDELLGASGTKGMEYLLGAAPGSPPHFLKPGEAAADVGAMTIAAMSGDQPSVFSPVDLKRLAVIRALRGRRRIVDREMRRSTAGPSPQASWKTPLSRAYQPPLPFPME